MDFAAAMRAATKLTRAQKLMEATRVIQSALLLGRGPTEPQDEQAVEVRATEPLMIDITPNAATTGAVQAWGTLPRRSAGRNSQTSGSMAWRASSRANPRDPRRRSVLKPVLFLRRRKAKLQALYSEQSSCRRMPSIGRHAAWRHAGCRRLRRRDPHECFGRGAWISRCLSKPVQERQSIALLELVQAGGSSSGRWRAFDHRRNHQRNYRRT